MKSYHFDRLMSAYGHNCEIETTRRHSWSNPQMFRIGKFYKWYIDLVVTSPRINRIYTNCIESFSATSQEQERQLLHYKYRIHPFSNIRLIWDAILCFTMFGLIIYIPLVYLSTFDFLKKINRTTPGTVFCLFADFVCLLNIPFNLLTGYYVKETKFVEFRMEKVLSHYIKYQLLIDLMLILPTSLHFYEWSPYNHFTIQSTMTVKLVCCFICILPRMTPLLNYWQINYFNCILITHGILIFLYWHLMCCMLRCLHLSYLFVNHQKVPERIWVASFSLWEFYVDAIYHGSTIIYLSGCYKLSLKESVEYLINCLSWYLSKIFFIYILAKMMQIIKGGASSKYKYYLMEKQLIYYMQQKQLPLYLQERILTYYNFRFHRRYFREYEIMTTLSEQLKYEITMHSCKELVGNVVFFSHLPIKLLLKIISSLKKEIYLVNDVIIKANTPAESMYFISVGTVAVYTKTGKEICHLRDGSYFGEIAILMKNTLRTASVVAVEISEIYRLDRNDFVKTINPYPDLLASIRQIAADRMEITTMYDDYFRRLLEERQFKNSN